MSEVEKKKKKTCCVTCDDFVFNFAVLELWVQYADGFKIQLMALIALLNYQTFGMKFFFCSSRFHWPIEHFEHSAQRSSLWLSAELLQAIMTVTNKQSWILMLKMLAGNGSFCKQLEN